MADRASLRSCAGEGILNEFPNVPRGGFGCSGLGRELGLGGLHEYTELKSINYTGSFAASKL